MHSTGPSMGRGAWCRAPGTATLRAPGMEALKGVVRPPQLREPHPIGSVGGRRVAMLLPVLLVGRCPGLTARESVLRKETFCICLKNIYKNAFKWKHFPWGKIKKKAWCGRAEQPCPGTRGLAGASRGGCSVPCSGLPRVAQHCGSVPSPPPALRH